MTSISMCLRLLLLTVNEHSEAEEVQVSLSSARVPADVGVALREKHRTHLQPAACQVRHHLHESELRLEHELIVNVGFSLCIIFLPSPGPAPAEPRPARCCRCRKLQPRPGEWSLACLPGEHDHTEVKHRFVLISAACGEICCRH